MQYLLLIYEGERRFMNLSKQDLDAEIVQYRAFGQEFASAIQGGNALQPTSAATTVRVRDGKRLTTDGPFAETKEQLGGYYLVEARDLDAAIAMAARIPGARHGSIEVRPIQKFD
jgi:hypothetical protein